LASDHDILEGIKELLAIEARALSLLVETVDADFVRAVRLMAECEGRVVTTGIGKAGIIAQKVGATLSSTGTPSLYLHPTEAMHGDLGRVTAQDVVLALSNSGNTAELLQLIGPLKEIGVPTVAITAKSESPLARHADVVLDYGIVAEAGTLGLAPTTSTTIMLALGDAVAMALSHERNFSREEFARFHPAGELGRSLMKVEEVMRKDDEIPTVATGSSLIEAVERMTTTPGRPGAVLIINADGTFAGLYTDGDLRRDLLESGGSDGFMSGTIDAVMTTDPVTIGPRQLVGEAVKLLRERKIDQLAVVDEGRRPVGLLDVQDLLELRALS
jgi:arabinose-5-phosphate isomerase